MLYFSLHKKDKNQDKIADFTILHTAASLLFLVAGHNMNFQLKLCKNIYTMYMYSCSKNWNFLKLKILFSI